MTIFDAIPVMQSILSRYQDCTIEVDTSIMVAKADQVSGAISNMENTFGELQRVVAGTTSYWIGEAADHHRQMFHNKKDEITKILSRLKEHPEDLKLMATGYNDTERGLVAANQQLRSDYI